ncbi:helix-turn-helix domain-containing protein [Dactylosporangium fulvum]|uniref:Helix-turn-helix domain-containing protein n=1 Tax=Dactylosporangium fulvum TaxID=53359 RepID=A0ABY5W8D1_9ACTN|nr:helix-turn-helix domain-containing protein [Dactylosporangium fulvum]UWP86132.1 helix-turn-helix domain-containing protein [Dactylosporangium fulvum]
MLTTHTMDLSTLPAAERFDYWQELVSQNTAPQQVSSAHADDFAGWAQLIPLGRLQLTSFRYPSLGTRRTSRLIRRGDPETYQLALPVTGESAITQQRHETVLRPAADFTLIDSSRPHEAKHAPDRPGLLAHSVTVIIPRDLLPLPPNKVARLTAARLASDKGMGALLANDLLHITRHPEQFRDVDAGFLARRIVDLVAVTIGQYLGETGTLPGEVKRRALRDKIDAFIDVHLDDAELTPQAIADAHSIAVRELHRLFEGGRSVSEEIKVRRLERCRRDLLDPTLHDVPIYAVARRHGIVHNTYFSRAFKAAFGMSPREFRNAAFDA